MAGNPAKDFVLNVLAGTVGDPTTPAGMVGWLAAICIVSASVFRWHRSRKEKGKAGMDSPYFLSLAAALALTCIAAIVYGLTLRTIPSAAFVKWPEPYHPIRIANQTFENQEIILDGHDYVKCNFVNVTFVYNGTTGVSFSGNNIMGKVRIRSDNLAVTGASILFKAFGMMKDTTLTFGGDQSGIVFEEIKQRTDQPK